MSNWGIGGNVYVRDGQCVIVVALESGSEAEQPVATMDDLDEVVTAFKIPAGRQGVSFHDDSWDRLRNETKSTSPDAG